MAQVWIGSYASYNAGRLYGKWIEVTDPETMREEISELMASDPEHGEEWGIFDTEGLGGVVKEGTGLETVCKIADMIEDSGEELVKGVIEHYGIDYIDTAIEALEDNYHGCYKSLADYAWDFYESTGVADRLRAIPLGDSDAWCYVDWEQVAHDFELSGDYFTVETGYEEVHVFSNC